MPETEIASVNAYDVDFKVNRCKLGCACSFIQYSMLHTNQCLQVVAVPRLAASLANPAAIFYGSSPTMINWLSTAFLFAFLVSSPFTFWALHTSGPRLCVIISLILILLGTYRPPSSPSTHQWHLS